MKVVIDYEYMSKSFKKNKENGIATLCFSKRKKVANIT